MAKHYPAYGEEMLHEGASKSGSSRMLYSSAENRAHAPVQVGIAAWTAWWTWRRDGSKNRSLQAMRAASYLIDNDILDQDSRRVIQ